MFYLIEIAKGDKAIEGKAVYEYSTLEEAEGRFHSKVGTAMLSDKYTEQTCLVIDSYGAVYASKHFARPVNTEETTAEA